MRGAKTKLQAPLLVMSVVAMLVSTAGSAHALTGRVKGVWQFWNKNGNFCPTTNACIGAAYRQASFDTRVPISNARVQIVNDSTGEIYGNGSTGLDGSYTVAWSAPSTVTTMRVLILPFEKNGTLFLTNTAGQLVNNTTGPFTRVVSGTVDMGTWFVGTSAAPDPFYNAYWAAEYQWRAVLALIGSAIANFNNVEIRGFADNIPAFLGNQPNSGANGAAKRVQLDANAGFKPQARVMHETGHVAEYAAHAWNRTMNYNWPDTTTFNAVGGWAFSGAEWATPAFEEALATHYGNIAFWADWSVAPTTCNSAGTCYTAGGAPAAFTNIEATSFPFATNNCSTAANNPESRWPLSQMRYLWDVFDNHNDADGDAYSANQGDFWRHLGVLQGYPNGTGANAIDESQVNRDGRGALAYSNNYSSQFGISTDLLRIDNCSPP